MDRNIKSLRVLAYHKIKDKNNFEKHLVYLKKNYAIITSEQLRQFFYNNADLPENPLLLTFDDGDLSVYDNAFALLKKYELPASLFVVTNLIDTQLPYWWSEIEYYMGKEKGRKKVWEVKKWANAERENFLSALRKNSNKPVLKAKQLTIAHLKEMQDANVTIGNHSHTHPMFDQCTMEELGEELPNSRELLEDFNFTSDIFAYPNGNYSRLSEKILKSHQIKMAFLFDHKINRGTVNPFRISRLVADDSTPLWKLKFILSGWHTKVLPLTKALYKLRN